MHCYDVVCDIGTCTCEATRSGGKQWRQVVVTIDWYMVSVLKSWSESCRAEALRRHVALVT